ncbi:MAG: UvrD-helicase domain-containing protein [Cyanobacteriota bacterium]|jgi:exodeoxyribonuclease V beta subunit
MAPSSDTIAPPQASQDFHPNSFPLDPGMRLLEASAGTGKTFALAHLVLRLVTEKAIPLPRLLVVTFTEAAAAELRERIGRRLQQALSALQDPEKEPADAVLAEWLDLRRQESAASGAGEWEVRLLLALEDLDRSDITTIHGFCQRSLQRHALEAQRPPGLTLDVERETLLEQVVHTYWQEQVLHLPLPLIRGLSRKGLQPDTLLSLLRTLDGDPGLALDPLPVELPVDANLAAELPRLWQQRWQHFKEQWQQRGADLLERLFAQARDWRDQDVSYQPYCLKPTPKKNGGVVDAFIAAQRDGEAAPAYDQVLDEEMLSSFLHPGTFCQIARSVEGHGPRPIQLPDRSLMEAVADLVDGPAELALLHACQWGRQELARRRQRLGLCSFADLLRDLDPGPRATAATPLLEAVAGRYSAALIDEFQDTDPIQWRILRLAFGAGRHALVMVGDPKQAIYRFRGGDLDTYLAARQAAGSCYQLRDNRRSSPELIDALNRLCERGLPRSRLAMPPLEAKADRGGDGNVPIELVWLGRSGPLPSSTEVDGQLPLQMAAHVARLLREPPLLREGSAARPLAPDDICLLVGTHLQAERLRQALQELGIASRLVSQADVYATPAATALQRLLDALADPADANRLRLLAASPLLGWSAETIASAPPLHWSALVSSLQRMAQSWPQQGLLGPLAAVLGAEQMARLAQGGRFLADLQQVAELVQQRLHREGLGPHAAARWLRRRRQLELDPVPEAEQTHSDKVQQAVAVVTVHRSKGLEYPLVICPYLWLDAGKGQGEGKRWHPDPQGPPRLDLHRNKHWGTGYSADRHQRLALEAERERLAYVALTRAMHRLVLAWVPAKGRQCNPLYPWLFADQPLPDPEEDWPQPGATLEDWRQRLTDEICRRRLPLRLLDPPDLEALEVAPATDRESPALALGPLPLGPLNRGWARSSYSSWTHDRRTGESASDQRGAAVWEEGRDTDDPSLQLEASLPVQEDSPGQEEGPRPPLDPERGLWADLPRGAGFGECLHRLLEQIDYGAELQTAEIQALAEHELRRAGLPISLASPLLAATQQMLQTPFGSALGSLRPADIKPRQRLNELHFDLSLGRVQASDLAKAFRLHPGGAFGDSYASSLERLPVNHCGFLTGSIDLVFPAQVNGLEQWWVLDWKSNWLGSRDPQGRVLRCGPGDYNQAALQMLMASHHYPLQAHLYLVALHRYLAWRLPAYSAERHLGGFVYAFVRGTPGEAGLQALPQSVPGMMVERPPLERLLALDRALGTRPPGWQPGSHP